MIYKNCYESPLGKILLTANDDGLTGLFFDEQKYLPKNFPDIPQKNLPIFDEVKRWLEIYFSGREPNFTPKLHMIGTNFRLEVWKILMQIPYGKITTYGEIAKKINSSARAVGGVVGHNPISIIIPCHRVIGSNGNLTGYAGGIDKKIKLLQLEGVQIKTLEEI